MAATIDLEKKVHAGIDGLRDELIKVALDLGDMDASLPPSAGETPKRSTVGLPQYHEKRASDYVYAWLDSNGFEPKRQGLPERPNVLAIHRGTGKGRSILFNSHLDLGWGLMYAWKYRNHDAPYRTGAWRDGDRLIGQGIINCKGPMACWLIAAKAIKDAGVELPGDILLSAVVGETGGAPIDEFEAPAHDSHELGARYVASHGGIADYMVCAEATGFSIVPTMTGFIYFKISVYAGPGTYTPYLKRPEPSGESSVNAIVRMGKFIDRFERYADDFAARSVRTVDGITMTPNATIGGIRGGMYNLPSGSPELCSIYCDFRVAPGTNPLEIQRDLEVLLADADTDGQVEMYKFLPGYDGWENKGFDTLQTAAKSAHSGLFGEPPKPVASQFVSMWRDLNPYNEIGVPAISYGFATPYSQAGATAAGSGPARASVTIADMVASAKVYASMALDLCSRSTSDPV